MLLVAGLLVAAPAAAQIGGPIGAPVGAPVGVPNALPSGATGYNANVGGGLPPPVNNWSAREAGRGQWNNRHGSGGSRSASPQQQEVPLPQYPVHNPQATPQGPAQDPRSAPWNDRPPTASPRDPRQDNWRGSDWRGNTANSGPNDAAGNPGNRFNLPQTTRPVASAAETSRVDVMRDLVQRGQLHETGLGEARDLNRAFSLYCEAGASGYPDALIRMGLMYANGVGVEKNLDAAGTLFGRAARFGSAMGSDLAKRYPARRELLPQCLKGTVVEKGTAERPATAAELAAIAQKLDPSVAARNPVLAAERARLVNQVIAEARQYRLDPRLVLAVMATESGFDPNARSPKNAFGLMQLIPETAERFAVRNILDPLENMRGGMAYLRWLLSYFRGDVTLTLAAYNAGEGAVEKHNGVPPFTETVAYVQRIRAIYPHDRHPYDPTAATTASRSAAPMPATTASRNIQAAASGGPARN